MAETAFDRTERGLGSTDLSVADIVAKTRGNPQQIMQLVMGGQINLTQGLLAKRLADSVVAEQQKAAVPTTTVLQDSFPQAAPPVQAPAAPPMQAPPGMGAPAAPPMQAPPGMAEGGLAQLDFAAPDYADGGMVSFAAGDELDPEQLRRALIQQESGGDYGILNAEGSGAMGAYQFMPDTARALARRLGLEYRPELMRGDRGRSEEGRAYQDRLGTAQLQDIIEFSGGDLNRAAAYHFAGPNQSGWGPRTRRYQQQLSARYGAGEGSGAAPAAGAAAAPATGNADIMAQIAAIGRPTEVDPAAALAQVRAAAPTSTAALEAYRARLGEVEDPEKVRKRAELGALFQAIGGVRPGMNPLEALAQGFAGTGASLQAAEERGRERELEQLRGVADIERMQNQMTREEFQLATQLAQAEAGRLDAASARQLAARLQVMDTDSKERIAAASSRIAMLELEQRGELGREELRVTEAGNKADYEAATSGGGNQSSYGLEALLGGRGITGFGMAPAVARPPARPYAEVTGRGTFPGFEIVRP